MRVRGGAWNCVSDDLESRVGSERTGSIAEPREVGAQAIEAQQADVDAGAGRDLGNTPRGLEFAPSLRQVSVRKCSGGCGLRAYESA